MPRDRADSQLNLYHRSKNALKCELAKCEILCANCHAIETRST
jgi:hypothetical protein